MVKQVQDNSDSELAAVEMRQALARKFAVRTHSEGEHATDIPELVLYRNTVPSACYPTTCLPSFSVVLQGRKLINLGGTECLLSGSSFLLSSIEAPIQSQIIEASEEVPFFAMRVLLDMSAVQEILSREDVPEPKAQRAFAAGRAPVEKRSPQASGLAVGKTTPKLLEASYRLLELLDTPADIPVLAPLIQRELVYRILTTPQGEQLRAIATRGDLSNRTVRAMAWLRANFTKPLRMEELAEIARMGVSTFHHQFRALTAMSPLQYQKQLRLYAARHRMLTDGIDVTHAAYEVGYESVSQFSREYSRFFGQPPMRDVRILRSAGTQQVNVRTAQAGAHAR